MDMLWELRTAVLYLSAESSRAELTGQAPPQPEHIKTGWSGRWFCVLPGLGMPRQMDRSEHLLPKGLRPANPQWLQTWVLSLAST